MDLYVFLRKRGTKETTTATKYVIKNCSYMSKHVYKDIADIVIIINNPIWKKGPV